jgi:hypothetical protein
MSAQLVARNLSGEHEHYKFVIDHAFNSGGTHGEKKVDFLKSRLFCRPV